MRHLASLLLLAAALVSTSACGGGGGSTEPQTSPPPGGSTGDTNNPPPASGGGGATAGVTVKNDFFSPATVTVAPGTTVKWTWSTCSSDLYGESCVSHNVTLDDGSDASPVQATGTFSHAFPSSGTYNYHCSVHGAAMTGKVVVQ